MQATLRPPSGSDRAILQEYATLNPEELAHFAAPARRTDAPDRECHSVEMAFKSVLQLDPLELEEVDSGEWPDDILAAQLPRA